MEDEKKHMRFLAACFALTGGATPKGAVKLADLLIEELENEENDDGGITSVVAKRKRSRNNS